MVQQCNSATKIRYNTQYTIVEDTKIFDKSLCVCSRYFWYLEKVRKKILGKPFMEFVYEFPIIRFDRKVVFEGDETNLKTVQENNKNLDRDKWSQPTNK